LDKNKQLSTEIMFDLLESAAQSFSSNFTVCPAPKKSVQDST
jgi:hypothetical protein